MESGSVLHHGALRRVQVELEFHNVAASLANDVLMTCLVDNRLEMGMFLVKSVILNKSRRLQERQGSIHR